MQRTAMHCNTLQHRDGVFILLQMCEPDWKQALEDLLNEKQALYDKVSVLQCAAVRCSALQCVAVCCSTLED